MDMHEIFFCERKNEKRGKYINLWRKKIENRNKTDCCFVYEKIIMVFLFFFSL